MIFRITRARAVFTLFFSVFCAVHWVVVHHFSIYLVPGAILFGAVAGMLTLWFSDSPSSLSSEQE
jgi:hypothetical protein